MTTTTTGLQYDDTVLGSGEVATKGQSVTVHYTGWLITDGIQGAKFDSSKDRGDPFVFALGAGIVIPPNATLKFDVELLAVAG